jgi:acetylcholinesterase
MLPKSILLQLTGWLLASLLAFAKDPTVTINTGTLIGRHLPEFNQDVYLGIPYAAKPQRFTPATLLMAKSKDAREVKQYGASCPSYGSDTTVLLENGMITLDEDCLNLNVIVPKGYEKKGLPVLVWIYGGGWMQVGFSFFISF